jgi:cytochrome c biogenesis protein CcdA
MTLLASAIVNASALWKIIAASLAAGAGVVIAFGILLLGLSRAAKATNEGTRLANYAIGVLAGVFCIGAVVIGIYAMAKKPASAKPKPAKSALVHRAALIADRR